MGAWGIGVFENDSALDWAGDFCDAKNKKAFLEKTFKTIVPTKAGLAFEKLQGKLFGGEESYIEEDEASSALAAAEIVAALNNKPCRDLSEEVVQWIEDNKEKDLDALKQLALAAVEIVKNKSELRELWEESEEFGSWITLVEELEDRLR